MTSMTGFTTLFSFSPGSGPINLVNVECSSFDTRLINCDRSSLNSCSGGNVAIVCSNMGMYVCVCVCVCLVFKRKKIRLI